MRYLQARQLLLLCPLLVTSSIAHAAINILVSFDVVEDQISPEQRVTSVRHTSVYILEGHSVRMSSDTNVENGGVIGGGHLAKKTTGASFVFQSKIQSNLLILKEIYSTEVITTTVRTNGRDTCSATRKDVLNPGQRFYQGERPSDHAHIISTDRQYRNVSCVISN